MKAPFCFSHFANTSSFCHPKFFYVPYFYMIVPQFPNLQYEDNVPYLVNCFEDEMK